MFPVPYCEGLTILNSLVSDDVRVTEGTLIEIQCLSGFAVVGQNMITCLAEGKYSDYPTCQKIGKNN